uniref:G-protein coupled receptors family 1 profile domain-containing protein n=1 Tax=Anopheles atroparvus TaxID=41427 RepID=A0A182JG04_ANOAO
MFELDPSHPAQIIPFPARAENTVSVSVAVWTLVAISLERYFAICRPLSSRRWQTQFHAYKMIGLVWTVSFLANSPLCYVQRLQPVLRAGRGTGQMKCREMWPDRVAEKAYVLFHDVGLLFLPLLTMGFAYSMIVSKLWRGLRHEIKHSSLYQQSSKLGCSGQGTGVTGGAGTAAGTVPPSASAPGSAYGGTPGGEAHPHSSGNGTDGGKGLKGGPGGGVKRHETGSYLHPSSMKKSFFKQSPAAAVNFAGNTGPSYHNNGSGTGQGTGASTTAVGCAGCSETTGQAPPASGASSDRLNTMECELCDNRTGRLRSFRHFFAKRHRGGLGRNQRYHLRSRSPEGLPELAETKFDECHQSSSHQQPQQQQHGYHHHYHQHPNHHHHHHHPHSYHHLHQHHQHRMPGETKHDIGPSGEPAAHEQRLLLPGSTANTGATASRLDAPSGPGTGPTGDPGDDGPLKSDPSYQFSRHAIRSTYMDKSIEAKKKVIRMLFVIIVEFFVCWAPLHILNTVYLYSPSFVYQYVNSSGIALVQLMAYISSCCNPITYCFMNRRFRQAFLGIFSCHRNRMPLCCCLCCASQKVQLDGVECKSAAFLRPNAVNHSGAERNNSDLSGNDSLVYVGRGIVQRSETDPDDESFRLRITWSKPSSAANYLKTATGCDSERYS